MKKIAPLIILCLIVSFVAWSFAGLSPSQLQRTPQQIQSISEIDLLQNRVSQLEAELALLKNAIRINGRDVEISSTGNVSIRAFNVSIEADIDADMKGNTLNLQGRVQNKITAPMVRIN